MLPYHLADRPIPTLPGFGGTYYPEGMENIPKRYVSKSYDRTMDIIGDGLKETQDYLAQSKADREAYYLELAITQ